MVGYTTTLPVIVRRMVPGDDLSSEWKEVVEYSRPPNAYAWNQKAGALAVTGISCC